MAAKRHGPPEQWDQRSPALNLRLEATQPGARSTQDHMPTLLLPPLCRRQSPASWVVKLVITLLTLQSTHLLLKVKGRSVARVQTCPPAETKLRLGQSSVVQL